MADPDVSTIKTPNINKKIMIGNSQNFFLNLRNAHNSFKYSTLLNFLKLVWIYNILRRKAMIAFLHYAPIGFFKQFKF